MFNTKFIILNTEFIIFNTNDASKGTPAWATGLTDQRWIQYLNAPVYGTHFGVRMSRLDSLPVKIPLYTAVG